MGDSFRAERLVNTVTSTAARVEKIVMREISLDLIEPFTTSRGQERARRLIIVEAHADDVIGYGEASPLSSPVYTEETAESIWHMLSAHLVPLALEWSDPTSFARAASVFRRNTMAKGALEGALWDLAAKRQGKSLSQLLGGSRQKVESGIAIGIPSSLDALIERVDRALNEGYRRIKIKIQPDWDYEPIKAIRQTFGAISLMADANSAYSPLDLDRIKRLDRFDLLMIEQPFDPDNYVDHARLQAKLDTPICLDESLISFESTRQALELGCCRVVNIKIGRVGGLTEALKIHQLCCERGVPLWCGGLLESGVGRAHNLALASMPGFALPPDLSASDRYYRQDVVEPKVSLTRGGWIEVPKSPGIGLSVKRAYLDEITVRSRLNP